MIIALNLIFLNKSIQGISIGKIWFLEIIMKKIRWWQSRFFVFRRFDAIGLHFYFCCRSRFFNDQQSFDQSIHRGLYPNSIRLITHGEDNQKKATKGESFRFFSQSYSTIEFLWVTLQSIRENKSFAEWETNCLMLRNSVAIHSDVRWNGEIVCRTMIDYVDDENYRGQAKLSINTENWCSAFFLVQWSMNFHSENCHVRSSLVRYWPVACLISICHQ